MRWQVCQAMYKQSGSRPALLSSLNVCFVDKPAVEGLDRFPYGRDSGRIEVISSPVPLFSLLRCAFDRLDEQFVVFGYSLLVPEAVVAIYLVSENGLARNGRNTFPFEYGEVVLRGGRQDNLKRKRQVPFPPVSDKMQLDVVIILVLG